MSKSGVRAPRPSKVDAPRGGPARAVADLLPDVGGAAFRRFGFIQSSVISRWSEIVGARFGAVSQPESIRFPHGKREDGVLTLAVRGAHGPMMQHVAPEIIERVNRFFGYPAVARIAFKQGALAPAKPAERAAPPSLKAVPIALGDSLRAIADPELKAVLEALAAGVAATRGAPVLPTRLGDDE
ncbi:MAG: DciA family protein [Sphingomonas sp.]|nr:DciA family protein [Sphingomonas sp.]